MTTTLPLVALILLAQVSHAGTPRAAPGPAAAASAAALPYQVHLTDGTIYTTAGPPAESGTMVPLRLTNGKTVVIYRADIDQQRTRLANSPPTPTPTAATARLRSPGTGSISIAGSASTDGGSSSSSASTATGSKGGPVQVRGYTTSKGTYVAPHTRAAPGTGRKK